MAGSEKNKQRIADLRGKHDRLSVGNIYRKSQAANKLLTQIAQAKLHRQILAKSQQMEEISRQISQLRNEEK